MGRGRRGVGEGWWLVQMQMREAKGGIRSMENKGGCVCVCGGL